MKNVLISIKPEWCKLIMSGQKTIEFRKTYPKWCPCKVVIYCSKGGKKIYKDGVLLNGKVIGEFSCNGVFKDVQNAVNSDKTFYNRTFFERQGCVIPGALQAYSAGSSVYGWEISNLKMYEKPKTLKDFGVDKAPQSWQYIN